MLSATRATAASTLSASIGSSSKAVAKSALGSAACTPRASFHGAATSREALSTRSHPSVTRSSTVDNDRYAIIHRFFVQLSRPAQGRAIPRSFSPTHRRSFFSAATKQKQFDDDDEVSQTERRRMQHMMDSAGERSARRDHPFHNYPRSLRELALQARARGSHKAEQERMGELLRDQEQSGSPYSIDDLRSGPEREAKQEGVKGQAAGEEAKAPLSTSRWTRPRPPSKEELLHIAQGFWTRMRIRFKWFTIRGFRRFNADDISAFFTLGGLGTVLFIIVGTTTAVSLFFSALNVLNMQEWIARKLADYLTSETGVTVIFESAIVPKWKDSRICFQNVFISRRAYLNDSDTLREERGLTTKSKRRRGRGTATTAGQGMAWEGTHFNEFYDEEIASPMSDRVRGQEEDQTDGRNTNFSMFDLNVDSIDVKLSFKRWWDGKGLVEDAVVEGVRGIIDRRNVHWDPDTPYDPRSARRQHKHGDFELVSLAIKDFLVTVYQPGNFRPFNLSIFEAQMPRLRRQWLFYDLLGADRITGQVDGCLFSLHKPQSIGRTSGREREIQTGRWKTLSRLRIDGINFDHIQNQSDVHGPVSWIRSGKFDVVADIKLPKEASSDIDINVIISEMIDHLTQAVSVNDSRSDGPIPGQHRLSVPAIEAPVTTVGPASEGAWKKKQKEEELKLVKAKRNGQGARWRNEMEVAAREASRKRQGSADDGDQQQQTQSGQQGTGKEAVQVAVAASEADGTATHAGQEPLDGDVQVVAEMPTLVPNAASVIIDLDVRFKDIKAAVPLFSSDLTYRTQTFVRPIVAFMNANHTLIPVHCRVVMDLSEFDGSMDLAQTGLLPIVSDKIYEALANHVQSQAANSKRIRNVSHWWLKLASDQLLQYARLVRDSMARNKTNATTTMDSSGHTSTSAASATAALSMDHVPNATDKTGDH